MRIKVIVSGLSKNRIFFSKLFAFAFIALYFVFLTTSLSTTLLIFLNLQEQSLIYQDLNHLLLFLNYLNWLEH